MTKYGIINLMSLQDVNYSGLPNEILKDNDSEFNAMNAWTYGKHLENVKTVPGCSNQNGYIESFNGMLRDKFLNQNIFKNISEARGLIVVLKYEYNHLRSNSSLDN